MLYTVGVINLYMSERQPLFSGNHEPKPFGRLEEAAVPKPESTGSTQERILAALRGVLIDPVQQDEIDDYVAIIKAGEEPDTDFKQKMIELVAKHLVLEIKKVSIDMEVHKLVDKYQALVETSTPFDTEERITIKRGVEKLIEKYFFTQV
jgi:hypothetical protein